MPSLLWQLHHSEDGSRLELPPPPPPSKSATPSPKSTKSSRAQETQQAQAPNPAPGSSDSPRNAKNQHQQQQQQQQGGSSSAILSSPQDLPSLESAFQSFLTSHPGFASTSAVDETRESEYPHLRSARRACFDYCGFGLFSYTQRLQLGAARSDFVAIPAASSGGLHAQAAYASNEPGTLQSELRLKVLDYLNVADGYSLVFTASKRAAFNLVADCYDFRSRSKLLTVYDHESESIKLLVGAAKRAGAKISAARFRWPMLRICGDELAAALKSRSKTRRSGKNSGKNKGLFVFPTQSRITGTKYSYQWMTLAEKNRWDVLLDVSAMGPRDMGSLGLSLFRPDFIICSFYKVFGADPTGFGCLLIKNTSLSSLRTSSSAIGLVRLVPETRNDGEDDDEAAAVGSVPADSEGPAQKPMIAFSGPVTDQPVSLVSEADAAAFHEAILASAAAEEDQDQDHEHEDEEHHGNGNGDAHGEHLVADHHREEQEEQEEDHHESECEIQEVNDHASSSSSGLLHREDPSCSSSSSYAQDDGGDQLRALPNGDAHHDDDSIFRRIGRDEGLIDSRRSDKFSRFLPIREEEEDDGQEPSQQMPSGGICRNRDDLGNSASWRHSSNSWRNNSSSWDAEGDYYYDDEELGSEDWDEEDELQQRQQQQREHQPLIVCRGLDHANSMGLNKTNCRIKSLMDWLITSLASLFHQIPPSAPTSTSKKSRRRPLVQIFGPKAQIDRGPAVAFNLYDQKGALIQPALVQKLADRSSISLGCGCLSNLYLEEVCVTSGSGSDKETNPTSAAKSTSSNPPSSSKRKKSRLPEKCSNVFTDHSGSGAHGNMKKLSNLPVLTATLGLVSNFEDVYRLWAFTAKFLEPDFVTGELLRYQSLNQETVIVGGDEITVAS